MHIEARKGKRGTDYSIATLSKYGKRLHVRQGQHPLLKTYADAERWVNSHEATLEASKAAAIRKYLLPV